MHYMSSLWAGGEIFEMLTVCIIFVLNLNTLIVRFCTGLSLFFLHYQYAVIHMYLMC